MRRPRAPWAAAVVVALGLTLTGCSSTASTLADEAASGLAAVQTARLIVSADRAGRSTFAVTSTTLTDATRLLSDAHRSTHQLDAATTDERRLRNRTSEALRDGMDAVAVAREAMRGVGSLATASDRLEHAAKELDALARQGGTR